MYRAQCGIAGQFVTHEVGFGFTFVIFDQRAAREITIRGQYAPKEQSEVGFREILGIHFYRLAFAGCSSEQIQGGKVHAGWLTTGGRVGDQWLHVIVLSLLAFHLPETVPLPGCQSDHGRPCHERENQGKPFIV